MASVLETYLSAVEHDTAVTEVASLADRAQSIEEIIAMHTALLKAMERRLGDQGIQEKHRPLIPLFQRWTLAARRIAGTVWELNRAGVQVAGIDDLMFSINHAKTMTEEFDHFVELNERLARGEPGNYRPLSEVMNDLRNRPG